MKARPIIMVLVYGLLLTLLGNTVFAFGDTDKDPNAAKIEALQKSGVISGTGNGQFNPKGTLSYASGVSLIVKGLELNLDHIRFIRKPEVSDQFENLKDGAWYADAFITAHYNGLDIPKDVKANTPMTREQYADLLMQAMLKKGDFAFIEMYMIVADEEDISPDYKDSVQKLLITNIAKLDDSGKFHPKKPITRSDAAGWLYDVIEKVKTMDPIPVVPEESVMPLTDLKLTVAEVNKEVNKVTVAAEAPHPGYGLRITSVSFEGDEALIYVETVKPDPDLMYPQVITEVRAETYVAAGFEPKLAVSGSSSGASGEASSSDADADASVSSSDEDVQ